MTESLLLSFAGGAAGLAFGYSAIRALLAVNTAHLPRVGENGVAVFLDWRGGPHLLWRFRSPQGLSLAFGLRFRLRAPILT